MRAKYVPMSWKPVSVGSQKKSGSSGFWSLQPWRLQPRRAPRACEEFHKYYLEHLKYDFRADWKERKKKKEEEEKKGTKPG